MKVADHIRKAERFEATIRKLNSRADYEAIMWARMHAATQRMNGALHAKSVTPEDWDISHSFNIERYEDQGHLASALDDEFREALWRLTVFESLRQTHVRGQGKYGPEIITLAQRDFDRIEAFCNRMIGEADQ